MPTDQAVAPGPAPVAGWPHSPPSAGPSATRSKAGHQSLSHPVRPDRHAGGIAGPHAELAPDTRTGEEARVAGRVAAMRGHGKLRFATMEDSSGAIQLMFQADHFRGGCGRG